MPLFRTATVALLLASAHASAEQHFVRISDPAYSSDGKRIAYVYAISRDEQLSPAELRVARADGSGAQTIVPPKATGDAAVLRETLWTPDGKGIVFASSGPPAAVYRVDADGSRLRRIGEGAHPRLSRGTGFVWFSAPDRTLVAADVLGGPVSRSAFQATDFDVSVEGLLVFVRDGDLYSAPADATTSRRLTQTPEPEAVPRFSPDGRRIAYLSGRAFYVMSLADGTSRQVAQIQRNERFPSPPAWSPDGHRLALSTVRLLVAYENGGARRAVTVVYGSSAQGISFEKSPTWSPDGRRILYVASPPCPGEQHKLAVVASAGGAARFLADDCVRVGTPRADRLLGTAGPNFINGRGGNDRISTGAGDDVALGGAGDDTIVGGPGTKHDDCLYACNRLEGGAGDDLIVGLNVWSAVDGGPGDDRLISGIGQDEIRGGPGRDVIDSGAGADVINVRDGFRDRVACGGGRDFVLADRLDVVARDCEHVVRPRRH